MVLDAEQRAAVVIGAVDLRAERRQKIEGLPTRVPVVVFRADRDERHARLQSLVEGRLLVSAAVVVNRDSPPRLKSAAAPVSTFVTEAGVFALISPRV